MLLCEEATAGSVNNDPRKPSHTPNGAFDSPGPLSSIASCAVDITHNRSDTSIKNNDIENLAVTLSVIHAYEGDIDCESTGKLPGVSMSGIRMGAFAGGV